MIFQLLTSSLFHTRPRYLSLGVNAFTFSFTKSSMGFFSRSPALFNLPYLVCVDGLSTTSSIKYKRFWAACTPMPYKPARSHDMYTENPRGLYDSGQISLLRCLYRILSLRSSLIIAINFLYGVYTCTSNDFHLCSIHHNCNV